MGGEEPELLLRLKRPAPGLAHVVVVPLGDQTVLSIRFHLYGDKGAAAAPDTQHALSAWLAEHFPEEAAG